MATISLSGGEKLERRLAALSQSIAKGGTLRVGFLEGETYPDGTPIAMVAATNNFGAPGAGIPPRPFFNKFINDNKDEWGAQLSRLLQGSNFDVAQSLNIMGQGMVGQLQTAIMEMNDPPLSEVTLLLRSRFPKGDYEASDVWQAFADIASGETPVNTATGAKPLVWSGQMYQAVNYEVVTDDGESSRQG
jgi:hypothetical protein